MAVSIVKNVEKGCILGRSCVSGWQKVVLFSTANAPDV